MNLIVVRHGETEENRSHIVQGHLPGSLTQLGVDQAKQTGKDLCGHNFDAAYSSDLRRCLDTANMILEHHPYLDLIPVEELRERHFGVKQGTKSSKIDWDVINGDFWHATFEGGESNLALHERIRDFVNVLLEKHKNQNVLIVTHGGPVRVIDALVNKSDLQELFKSQPKNAGINHFVINEPLS